MTLDVYYQKEVLHTALLKLKKLTGKQVLNVGICEGVADVLYDTWKCGCMETIDPLLFELFKKWPEFSGNIYYTVPSGQEGLSPKDAYESLELWVQILTVMHDFACSTFLLKKQNET